ncbi:hypothetical protein L1889_12020 [Paenalcaligenes niemegkensis]|uniref:cytochrome c biogenesis protein CcdA n=1 Tax=Paenalcaligenes niemegkensis TaxID=2895469 RepID=UPI001EE80D8C|nr:hypothetical protein [Paenalcaligenes niemegkensis]MCQ9617332.1 hypothetical protein [Paenalcaligenes niemegkensis]
MLAGRLELLAHWGYYTDTARFTYHVFALIHLLGCAFLGMGVPLLISGTTAGALLPKAGRWMLSVRNFRGVMMLAVAIFLIFPIIPSVVHMIPICDGINCDGP